MPTASPAVQSVPPQGKLPQVFETSSELVARAEWNALLPRQARPADIALLEADGGTRTAAITGGWVALALAARRLVRAGKIRYGLAAWLLGLPLPIILIALLWGGCGR